MMNDIHMTLPDLKDYPNLKQYMEKKDKYILDDDKNVIPATLFEWGLFLEYKTQERIVKKEDVGNYHVSTVFIGLDHNLCCDGTHKPHIFETMVFNDRQDIYCDRYSTWQEAEEGHQKAVQWVKDNEK